MPTPEKVSPLMKALCGLLFLAAFAVVVLIVSAQSPIGTYEGRPLYDCTQPVSPEVAALASLPLGPTGHSLREIRKARKQHTSHKKLRIRRKRR